LQASVAANFESGRHLTRQIRTPSSLLNQGGVPIIMERNLRLDSVQAIDVSIGRQFDIAGDFRLRVQGSIYNLLNSDNPLSVASLLLQTPGQTFQPDFWTQPRRLELRVGFEF
jgi:hypothetical protein